MLAGLAVAAYLALLLWMGNRSAVRQGRHGRLRPRRAAQPMVGRGLWHDRHQPERRDLPVRSRLGGSQQFGYMQMVLGYLVGYGAIIGPPAPVLPTPTDQHLPPSSATASGRRPYTTGSDVLPALPQHRRRLPTLPCCPGGPTKPCCLLRAGVLAPVHRCSLRESSPSSGPTPARAASPRWCGPTPCRPCMLLAAGRRGPRRSGAGLVAHGHPGAVADSGHARWWFFDDWGAPNHGVKQFIAGAFIALCMTGLDQDMMQKNLSCRSSGTPS